MSTRTAHPRPVPDRAASLRQLVDDTVRRLRACTWNQYVLIEYGESEVLGLQRPDRASDGTFASVRRGRLARDLRRSVGTASSAGVCGAFGSIGPVSQRVSMIEP